MNTRSAILKVEYKMLWNFEMRRATGKGPWVATWRRSNTQTTMKIRVWRPVSASSEVGMLVFSSCILLSLVSKSLLNFAYFVFLTVNAGNTALALSALDIIMAMVA